MTIKNNELFVQIKLIHDKTHQAIRIWFSCGMRDLILSFCWNRPFGLIDENGQSKQVSTWKKVEYTKHNSGKRLKITYYKGVFFMFNYLYAKGEIND